MQSMLLGFCKPDAAPLGGVSSLSPGTPTYRGGEQLPFPGSAGCGACGSVRYSRRVFDVGSLQASAAGQASTAHKTMSTSQSRVSVVILTHNRVDELRVTLERMCALPERPAIIVVDNASTDTTSSLVRERFPQVTLISLERNIGGAARNVGVRQARTPYVAFCDDDSWWDSGSIARAQAVLDAYPRVAAVCARILLGADQTEDPICAEMAASPLPSAGLPGPALLGFVACAVVFRREPYLNAGGYEPRFFVGGEEELLALDLVAGGWSLVYVPQLVVYHHPSPRRDNVRRQTIVIRNTLWVAWLRLPR